MALLASVMADSGKSATVPVIAGLAVGIGLVVLFAMYTSSEKPPPPVILPPAPDGVNLSEMPDDFSVIYAYGVYAKNVLNTQNNTFTWDMVSDPPIIINLTLTESELATIWNATQENQFFSLKNLTDFCPQHPSPSQCTNIIPEQEYILTITANGEKHTVMLRQNYELNQGQDPDIHKFKNIGSTIRGILSQRDEIKQLPKPESGYA
jgi:hypothetical protein